MSGPKTPRLSSRSVEPGTILPRGFEDRMFELYVRESPFSRLLPPLKPLTRRQRIVVRYWWPTKAYLRHLGLALVGRCDRERDDYW
jgi:hypothetical protein